MRPYLGKTLHKNRAGGVAQDEGPEFKSQYCKKKKKRSKLLFYKMKSLRARHSMNATVLYYME
jgi:hypothetical protein